jgi:hypothetical protein
VPLGSRRYIGVRHLHLNMRSSLAMDSVQNHLSPALTIALGPVGQYTLLPDLLREINVRALDIALTVKSMPPEKMKQIKPNTALIAPVGHRDSIA